MKNTRYTDTDYRQLIDLTSDRPRWRQDSKRECTSWPAGNSRRL